MWRPRSKKGGSIKARRPFPFAFLQFLNSIFDIYSLSTFPPLSTNLSKKKKKDFKVQVVHSYCYTFSSLSGKEYYNQHYNVTSFSLNIVFTYMYFKIITLVGKRNLQSRAMSSYPSCCAVCLSHPFSPFPVKSCKKFKADEVYC